jgi:hypothetical protein
MQIRVEEKNRAGSGTEPFKFACNLYGNNTPKRVSCQIEGAGSVFRKDHLGVGIADPIYRFDYVCAVCCNESG